MTARVHTRAVRHTIVGTPATISNALDTADRQGRLVRGTVTTPQPRRNGRYVVTAVLLEPAVRPAKRRADLRRYGVTGAAVTAVVGALAAFGWVLVLAVRWVSAHMALIGAVLVALAALALVLRRKTGACMGLHCAGCGHR